MKLILSYLGAYSATSTSLLSIIFCRCSQRWETEYWNDGIMEFHKKSTSIFHHSSFPLFLFFQRSLEKILVP